MTHSHSDSPIHSVSNAIQNQSEGSSSAITQLYDHFMNYGYRYALCITAATGILAASYYFYTIDNKSKAKPYLSLKGEKSMNNGQAEDQSVESEDFHEGIVIYINFCCCFITCHSFLHIH